MRRETGIKDINGKMVHEGDTVCFPHIDNKPLVVVWVGDGDGCDWAADKKNGKPDSWLDSTCEIIR
jgi:hypothetical protein